MYMKSISTEWVIYRQNTSTSIWIEEKKMDHVNESGE